MNIYDCKLYVIVGLPASGKSTFLEVLKDNNDFLSYDWSDIFKPYTNKTYNRNEILDQIKNLIKKEGRFFFIDRIIDIISKRMNVNTKAVVICGARHPIELSYLLGKFNYNRVVYIHSDTEIRFKRCINRNRKNDPKSLNVFITSEYNELRSGLADLLCEFGHETIVNNESIEIFKNKITNYFNTN